MPLAESGTLVADAAARRGAVAAFNIITLEHAEAVIAGAEAAGAPVILQISENAVKYRQGQLLPLARAATEAARLAAVPVALHLDHVKSDALLRQAADAGFSSVMYDAAHLPYAENLAATRNAAEWAHSHGLWIEAELGEVGGKDGAAPLDAHAPGARTEPEEARAFVADSGVDALAVAIGSSHAMTSRTAVLDHDLLGRLRKALDVPLVLHGSSGVPDAELSAAVTGGIAKVNIGTALNIAMTTAIREVLTARPEAVDSRTYLKAGRQAMAETVTGLITLLGAATAA
ncbi:MULTISPECIES: class II fructose-bisphosphate aldolase [unclassified Streptomyces]|uniref:class II fructose-bisphosphate aldolase n=1 Tax=unclassified Streptomyces TaxID=2593676 RepID=UPI0022585A29|nr:MULTISPECIES: class II fructose-bisphosphate aldolase [unclassified Streptomyces]MCX4547418.1 class II fructose-bisphosphate aldolase family protein [Streptomyces sp. NBC_01500]WSC19142.1 class II fructose-bisphosphate aldolase family protein [Streptomyces sp. NBC_01766]